MRSDKRNDWIIRDTRIVQALLNSGYSCMHDTSTHWYTVSPALAVQSIIPLSDGVSLKTRGTLLSFWVEPLSGIPYREQENDMEPQAVYPQMKEEQA